MKDKTLQNENRLNRILADIRKAGPHGLTLRSIQRLNGRATPNKEAAGDFVEELIWRGLVKVEERDRRRGLTEDEKRIIDDAVERELVERINPRHYFIATDLAPEAAPPSAPPPAPAAPTGFDAWNPAEE
jgi:hypothetical protein